MDIHQHFYRDTWVEINLDHVKYNIYKMKQHLPEDVEIMAVVKANAYGHGAPQVAKAALESGATRLAVAFLDEALSLRQHGIDAPILILGSTRVEDAAIAAEHQISLAVHSLEWLKKVNPLLSEAGIKHPLTIHLKCDTGMNRIGLRTEEEVKEAEKLIKSTNKIFLEGIFTHYATADEHNQSLTKKQLERFHSLINAMEQLPPMVHTSNSAASLRFPEAYFNAVRMGISMYGLSPSEEIKSELPFPLKSAFSLYTKVKQVKRISKGETVSYGATYMAEDDEWIATIPIGYADGWLRRLSGQTVLVNGKRAPIVGRICMDQCMVKLPAEVMEGTAVTLIGADHEDSISVDEIAKKLETINYEVVCQISTRVPRVYLEDGEIVEIQNPILK